MKVNAFEPRGMSGGLFFGMPDIHRAAILGGIPALFPAGLIIEKNDEHQALFGPALSVIFDQIRAQSAG